MKISQGDRLIILSEINYLREEEGKFYYTSQRQNQENFYESLPDKCLDESQVTSDKKSFLKALEEFGDRINTKQRQGNPLGNMSEDFDLKEKLTIEEKSEDLMNHDKRYINEASIEAFDTEGGLKFFLPINAKKSSCWVCLRIMTKDKQFSSNNIKNKVIIR